LRSTSPTEERRPSRGSVPTSSASSARACATRRCHHGEE
jgi:hypothetical protein